MLIGIVSKVQRLCVNMMVIVVLNVSRHVFIALTQKQIQYCSE